MPVASRFRSVPPVVWAILFGVVLLLPGLGGFGFWDPWELNLADRARELARSDSLLDVTLGGRHRREPPLDIALSALGVRLFGASEWGARLPNALLGIGALLAVYWAGLGLYRRRAALLSALALGTMPLFFLQARQLTSDMGLVAGLALACGGLGRFAWPSNGQRRWLDLAIAVAGMVVGWSSGGLLLGVALPCLVLCAALLVGWSLVPDASNGEADGLFPAGTGPDVPAGRGFGAGLLRSGARGRFALVLLPLLGVAALAVTFSVGYVAGEYSPWLGGSPRGGTAAQGFPYFLRQLGFGLFPWSAVAVFALGRAFGRLGEGEGGGRHARQAFVESYLLLWAALGFALFTLFVLTTGEARFAALAPLALAVGAFLDEALSGAPRPAEPVLGFLVAAATLVIARDIHLAPEEMASAHLLATLKWPPLLKVGPAILLVGLVVAAGLYLALALRANASGDVGDRADGRLARLSQRAHRVLVGLGRRGVAAAVLVSVLGALAVNHALVPALSHHFSFKPVFQSFARYSKPGDALGRYRVEGHGAQFYGADDMQDIPSQDRLLEFFRQGRRAFCLVSTDDLAALDAAFKGARLDYHVIDASSSRFLLLSNRLLDGEQDRNPLRQNVWMAPNPPTPVSQAGSTQVSYDWQGQKPPWTWPVDLKVSFQDAIELVGAEFPSSVRRPGKIPLKLYFRINQRPQPGYKIFVHLDTPGHPRLIGDHDPLQGAFPTSYWLPGEYIRDEIEVDVPYMTTPAGQYTLFVGFWPGGNANRLRVTSGPSDGADRAQLGTIHVR